VSVRDKTRLYTLWHGGKLLYVSLKQGGIMENGYQTIKLRLVANALFLFLFFVLLPIGAAAKDKGYIMIGDINPQWYSLLIRSVAGQVDPYKDIDPIIQEQRKRMEAMGLEVVFIQTAAIYDFKKAVTGKDTIAIAWFGHGDPRVPGTISTLAGEDLTPGDISEWAREELKTDIGDISSWKSLPPEERKERIARWNSAHFNLEYVYMHTCYGMKDNALPDALMADEGEFWGYRGTAYLTNASERAIIRKDINPLIQGSNSGKSQDSSDIPPPFNGKAVTMPRSISTKPDSSTGTLPMPPLEEFGR
jgi:hypothetical protein